MELTRRKLLEAVALGGAAAPLGGVNTVAGWAAGVTALPLPGQPERETQGHEAQQAAPLPRAFDALQPLGDRAKPITVSEFQARITRAQQLMTDSKPHCDALYLAPGTSLYYFTGIRWGTSERAAGAVIPRTGSPLLFCPGFEESRFRELMRWPMEIRVWQEDQNPGALVGNWLAEHGVRSGLVAINETTPYTYFDKLSHAAPGLTFALADPVTAGCRAQKTEHELELMRLACAATIDVYRAVFASVEVGMTQYDVSSLYSRGLRKMGLPGDEGLVLVGKWAAQPHGTTVPQQLREGEVLLIDAGTRVEGYASDVTRCTVLGTPSDKIQRAFDTLRKAQDAALEALRAGQVTGSVDEAARAVVVGADYGPGYKYFAHRLGHGIGLDGHEHPYLVRGSSDLLAAGMTFSNEPGIYVAGDFGLRLEDDMVVMSQGPGHLLTPSFQPSLAKPCG